MAPKQSLEAVFPHILVSVFILARLLNYYYFARESKSPIHLTYHIRGAYHDSPK